MSLVGLRGAGQEQVGRALIGDDPAKRGRVSIKGQALRHSSPNQAVQSGIGFVAADRVAESVAAGLSVRENMFINPSAAGRGLFSPRHPMNEANESKSLGADIGLSPNNPEAAIETLSGGNQQKVLFGRMLLNMPNLLILVSASSWLGACSLNSVIIH